MPTPVKDNIFLRHPDAPAFIPEGQENRWPQRGPAAELVGYIPDGYTAEDVLSGKVARDRAEAEEKATKKGK
jgi:hypothetical protein